MVMKIPPLSQFAYNERNGKVFYERSIIPAGGVITNDKFSRLASQMRVSLGYRYAPTLVLPGGWRAIVSRVYYSSRL
jgi:hypothetical protein